MAPYPLHMLISNPWVGVTYTTFLIPAAEHLARAANGAVAHLLVRPMWEARAVHPKYVADVRRLMQNAPNLRVTYAAATPEDDVLYRQTGLHSICCSHNAFIDETLFAPDPDAEKLYDAIYVGRFTPFKRHELATLVPRIAVLATPDGLDEAYADASIAGYRDLRFVNYESGVGVTKLPPEDVRRMMTQSRCGLALSAIEGAMYASIEYLLSGLPVVTTPSQGGRDAFFHPDYVETVESEPTAVAAGVQRILARGLDPQMIRARTIGLMKPHRARLLMWLSGIAQQNLFPLANENFWLPSFRHKLDTWIT